MSNSKEFDLLVFIGRFQPPHNGHLAVIREGMKRARHLLILVGSSNSSRSLRNPFTFEERRKMIDDMLAELPERPDAEVSICALNDHLYNEAAWIESVQFQVRQYIEARIPGGKWNVGIIGHSKDRSSYYLRVFPGYACVDVPGVLDFERILIGSTSIRELLYGMNDWNDRLLSEYMPHAVVRTLRNFANKAAFLRLIAESDYIKEYKAKWKLAPFAPVFVTVDAVVQCCGHLLMVIRGSQPGRGSLALPGGFIEQDETLFDACMRELYEETQISVPRKVLLGAVHRREARVFDHPFRSDRGRTITHAFRFDLQEKELPRIRGGDDAVGALWVPISAIQPDKCFEDHAHIIRAMLGVS